MAHALWSDKFKPAANAVDPVLSRHGLELPEADYNLLVINVAFWGQGPTREERNADDERRRAATGHIDGLIEWLDGLPQAQRVVYWTLWGDIDSLVVGLRRLRDVVVPKSPPERGAPTKQSTHSIRQMDKALSTAVFERARRVKIIADILGEIGEYPTEAAIDKTVHRHK